MIELKEITKDNYENVICLKVSENQEGYVSANVYSLAQAYVYNKTAFPFAIYADDMLVGFIMLGHYEIKKQYTLWKFMIDKNHQNKGYGKKALQLGIEYLKNNFSVNEIYTAYAYQNTIASDLYRSFGFKETGNIDGIQIEMRLELDS